MVWPGLEAVIHQTFEINRYKTTPLFKILPKIPIFRFFAIDLTDFTHYSSYVPENVDLGWSLAESLIHCQTVQGSNQIDTRYFVPATYL